MKQKLAIGIILHDLDALPFRWLKAQIVRTRIYINQFYIRGDGEVSLRLMPYLSFLIPYTRIVNYFPGFPCIMLIPANRLIHNFQDISPPPRFATALDVNVMCKHHIQFDNNYLLH